MKDTGNNRKRGKWGFTLAELLVVVAIITILAGASFVAVLRYQSRLRRLEMDQTAKEIFLAAQNRLSLESSQGIMARLLEQGESEGKLGIKASDSDAVYVVLYDGGENDSTGEIRERLLPFGSIDETVRTDGNYLVFYEPGTGSVRGVWYSDRYQFVREDIGSEALTEAAADPDKRERFCGTNNAFAGHGQAVGYYGGESSGSGDQPTAPEFQPISMELFDGPVLYVKVYDPNMLSNKDYDLKLFLEGMSSGAECWFDLKKDGSRQNGIATSEAYYYVLDDVTEKGLRFADLNEELASNFEGTERLIPGEDIRVCAKLFAPGGSRVLQSSGLLEANSLFESKKEDKVAIGDLRHLENLDYRISEFDPVENGERLALSTVGDDSSDQRYAAVQQKALSWEEFREDAADIHRNFRRKQIDPSQISVYYMTAGEEREEQKSAKAGCFVPVDPQFALDYHGNTFSVDGIRIETEDGVNGGLFGNVTKNLTVDHLILRRMNVTANGTACAGALIGRGSGESQIDVSDVLIQYPEISVNGTRNAASGASVDAGGVVGTFDGKSLSLTGVLVENSFRSKVSAGSEPDRTELSGEEEAALRIFSSYGAAGGLIGSVTDGNLKISASASSVYVDGKDYVGGLIGSAVTAGKVMIDGCYVGGHTSEGKFLGDPVPGQAEFEKTTGRYNIVSRNTRAGGLAGVLPAGSAVSHSYVTASVYSNAVTRSRNTEQGEAPDADQPQREAAFVGVYGSIAGNFGVSGRAASEFPFCYSSVYVNGARAAVHSEDLNGEFASDKTRDSKGFPYDRTLEKTYPMPTVLDLMKKDGSVSAGERDGLSKYVRVHIGDWVRMIPAGSEEPIPTPDPEPADSPVTNGNRLYVEQEIDLPADGNRYVTFSVTGTQSGKSIYYIVKPVSNGEDFSGTKFSIVRAETQDGFTLEPGVWLNESNDIEKRLEYSITEDGKMKIRLYVDNLSVNSGGYQALWDNWNGENRMDMKAGEDIEIGVCDGIRIPEEPERTTVNSLFQSIAPNDDGDETYTAYVSNARHLENLNFFGNTEWKHNRIKVTRVIQRDNIIWTADDEIRAVTKYGAGPYCGEMDAAYENWIIYGGTSGLSEKGCFVPINNPEIRFYDGGGFTIAGLNMEMGGTHQDQGASLFVSAPSMEISNLKLKDPRAIAKGSGNAALLIQSVGSGNADEKKLVLKDIEIYGDDIQIASGGYGNSTGGLVGSADVDEVDVERVSLHGRNALVRRRYNGGTVGGFIGSVKTKTFTMDQCIYSGYIAGGTNTEGCGGFIGKLAASEGMIKNSYVAGRNDSYPYAGLDHRTDAERTWDLTDGVSITGVWVVGGLIGTLDGKMTVGQCFVAAGISDSGSSGGYSGGTGGLIGCVTGNKKLEFQDCYFAGNIDRRGKTEKQDGGPTISRDWPGNTGIMAGNVNGSETSFYSCTYLAIPGLKGRYMVGNRSVPAVNLAAVPGEESMSNILSSGNENNADKTLSFSVDLSGSSYPYKIWTKNGEDQTVYYGDWIDWKKLQ